MGSTIELLEGSDDKLDKSYIVPMTYDKCSSFLVTG